MTVMSKILYYPAKEKTKKVLSNPTVDEFISTNPQPTEIENNLLLLMMTVTK